MDKSKGNQFVPSLYRIYQNIDAALRKLYLKFDFSRLAQAHTHYTLHKQSLRYSEKKVPWNRQLDKQVNIPSKWMTSCKRQGIPMAISSGRTALCKSIDIK